jgi:hypothetical protein
LADILYSSSLIQSLEKSLSSAFNRTVQLTKKPHKQIGEFTIWPVDGDTHASTNEGTERPICDIRNDQNKGTGFYFTFAAKFRQTTLSQYTLRHSSLQVFQDIMDVIPLFRAEWDQDATLDTTSEHAQPHWHFVQRPSRIEEIVRMMSPSTEFVPYEQSELFTGYADCGRFHFAMSPLWEKDKPNAHKRDYEPSDFPLWFENLTKYVAAQIAYVIMKAPPMPTKEFVPEEPSA